MCKQHNSTALDLGFLRCLFCFPQTLATRKINASTLAQKRTAMTNAERESKSDAKKSTNILIGIFLLGFGYLFGGLTVYKQIFPFEQARFLKNSITERFSSNKLTANPNWPERREQFEIFGRQADIVMIGDSITHAGHWDDIYPNIKIANRGIGSDRTDDVIRRLDNIISVKPEKAFVMIGINDLSWGRTVDNIFDDYKKIVNALKNKNIQVFIQSTLECSRSVCGNRLDKVRELNEKLNKYAKEQQLIFININEGLTNEEEGLRKEYTYDGIHLLGEGYVKWSKSIAPFIQSN